MERHRAGDSAYGSPEAAPRRESSQAGDPIPSDPILSSPGPIRRGSPSRRTRSAASDRGGPGGRPPAAESRSPRRGRDPQAPSAGGRSFRGSQGRIRLRRRRVSPRSYKGLNSSHGHLSPRSSLITARASSSKSDNSRTRVRPPGTRGSLAVHCDRAYPLDWSRSRYCPLPGPEDGQGFHPARHVWKPRPLPRIRPKATQGSDSPLPGPAKP